MLRTIRTYALWGLITVFFMPISMLIALLTGHKRHDATCYFWITRLWSRALLAAAGVRVRVDGLMHVPSYPSSPSIIIMNHTSALDIPLLETLLGDYPRVWLSKKEYGAIPCFGYLVRRMHVLVDRASVRGAASALLLARKLVEDAARHVVLFPEGTRSPNGELQPFLSGFLVLARKLNRPIVPIAAKNVHAVFPKGSWHIAAGSEIQLVVGKPLMPLPDETDEMFSSRMHAWFREQLSSAA